jgi:hypothetical protein
LQFFRGTKGNIKKLKHNRLFDYFRNTSPWLLEYLRT